MATKKLESLPLFAQGEQWREVAPGSFYEVSNLGRVRSWAPRGQAACRPNPCRSDKPRILKPGVGHKGHLYVSLGRKGETIAGKHYRWIFVHRLVAFIFHGSPPTEGAIVRHLDANPANNRVDNVAWSTHWENYVDTFGEPNTPHGLGIGILLGPAEVRRLMYLVDHPDADRMHDLLTSIAGKVKKSKKQRLRSKVAEREAA